jgi:hypothetical protein
VSQRRPEFNPRAPLERFILCNVALAQVSLSTFNFIFYQISIFKLIELPLTHIIFRTCSTVK